MSYATVSTGPPINDIVAQDAAATFDFIGASHDVLLAYARQPPP